MALNPSNNSNLEQLALKELMELMPTTLTLSLLRYLVFDESE